MLAFWVYMTPLFKQSSGSYSIHYFLLCILLSGLSSAIIQVKSVTQVAFFTRVSDKRIGATYLTLLNTLANIGSNWPQTLSLYLADWLTYKQCVIDTQKFVTNGAANVLSEKNIRSVLELIDANDCSNELKSKVLFQ
jgi:MFS transporter, PAT family, solute carrier family 33 (acetyl-CoA transportor), member 1